MRELGSGALLHDVGKVMISDSVLLKPSTLTPEEFDEAKKHTIYGYEILKRSKDICPIACTIALSHHERCDGSGYPYRLKSNDIPLPARIVAIADVFDALTSNRVYRKKIQPYEAVDYLCSLMEKQYDKTALDALVRRVAHYPIGTAVILNSGEKGLVCKYNYDLPNRPVIRVVMDEKNKKLQNSIEVDLSRKPAYSIVDIWDI